MLKFPHQSDVCLALHTLMHHVFNSLLTCGPVTITTHLQQGYSKDAVLALSIHSVLLHLLGLFVGQLLEKHEIYI